MPNKKEEQQRKTHNIRVRLDAAQYDLIQNAASSAGMSISEYIRRQAVYGKVEIHNHIQLTRYFHMGGLKSKSMTDELTRCINEIMRMRKDVIEMAGEYRGYTQTHRK